MKSNLKNIYLGRELINQIEKISSSDYPILIEGESGVGKEFVANIIHEKSKMGGREPVVVDLSTIPKELVEKELFGAAEGAYTGLKEVYTGKFQRADNNTIILDGISNIPLDVQGKLLHVLDRKEITPIGGSSSYKINTRIIAISNRNVSNLLNKGLFRPDLYYRINTFRIIIPPLRERPEMISRIVEDKLKGINENLVIGKEAISRLESMEWKGNIREIHNLLEREAVLTKGNEITLDSLLLSSNNNGNITGKTLKEAIDDFKRNYIAKVLDDNDGNVTKSSKVLGIQRTYLSRLIKELNIY